MKTEEQPNESPQGEAQPKQAKGGREPQSSRRRNSMAEVKTQFSLTKMEVAYIDRLLPTSYSLQLVAVVGKEKKKPARGKSKKKESKQPRLASKKEMATRKVVKIIPPEPQYSFVTPNLEPEENPELQKPEHQLPLEKTESKSDALEWNFHSEPLELKYTTPPSVTPVDQKTCPFQFNPRQPSQSEQPESSFEIESESESFRVDKVFPAGKLCPKPMSKRQQENLKMRKAKLKERQQEKEDREKQFREAKQSTNKVNQRLRQKAIKQDLGPVTNQKHAAEQIITLLERHKLYCIFEKGQTVPLIKNLVKILKSKCKFNLTLDVFQADIKRMFFVFDNSQAVKQVVKRQIKKLQYDVFVWLRQKREALGIKPSDADSEHQTPSTDLRRTSRNKRLVGAQGLPKDKPAGYVSSRGRRTRPVTFIEEPEKKLQRQDLLRMGKMIYKLPKKERQEFAILYCPISGQKIRGTAIEFNFNLLQIENSKLLQMQAYLQRFISQMKGMSESDSNSDSFVLPSDDD